MSLLRGIPILVALFFIFYVLGDLTRSTETRVSSWVFGALFVFTCFGLFAYLLRQSFRKIAKFEVQPIGADAVSAEFRSRVTELQGLGFQTLGPLGMLIPRKSPHSEPIASRPVGAERPAG